MRNNTSNQPLPEHLERKFDLGIWHALFKWTALTVAVQNQWGGPESSEKRDWLAGQISELFVSEPLTDAEDVEIMLLQVLEDEFGVRLEDETEVNVAKDIFAIRKELSEGSSTIVDALQEKWEQSKGKEVASGSVEVKEVTQEVNSDSDFDESDEDGDVDMGDAPAPALAPASARPKPVPEVDEDGFTKVVGKSRR